MPRRLLATAAAVTALFAPPQACARPFTVDDLLRQASLGAVAVDPGGHWIVFEQRDRYDTARRYDYNLATSASLSRLRIVDLGRPGRARALLRQDPGPGVQIAAVSPGGSRIAVYRLHDRGWSFGVVTVATGAVRWWRLTPQEAGRGRAVQWLSDRELLLIERPDGLAPEAQHSGWIIDERLPRFLAAHTRGEGPHTVLGSGAFAGVRTRAPANRLLRIDVAAGKVAVLATGELRDVELSPDGRRVALLAAGADLQARPGGPVRGPAGLETETSELSVLDLADGRRRALCRGCDVLPQLLSWSPSGRSLLVLARGPDGLWTSGGLRRIDVETGAATPVGGDLRLHMDLNPVAVWTAWMGEAPIALGRRAASGDPREDWFRLGGEASANLTEGLPAPAARVRLATAGALTVLTADGLWRTGPDGASRLPAEHPADAEPPPRGLIGGRLDHAPRPSFWLTAGPPDHRRLGILTADGFRPIRPAPARGQDWRAADPSAGVVLRQADAHGVQSLRLLPPAGGERTLVRLNPELAATDALDIRPVRHTGPEGQALTSWLILPPKACAGGPRPPLVVQPYLGANHPTPPRDPYMEAGFFQNFRVMTGHGYALLVPSLPRPGGRLVEPGAGLARRLLEVVDAAAKDPALARCFDPDRLALNGWSFGGYTTLETLTQTQRFRAAISLAGISDLAAYWASLGLSHQLTPEVRYTSNWSTGLVEQSQPTLLGPPWAEPDRYVRNSPLYAADRIETPLLLLHGWADAMPIAQSEAIYSALFRQAKDAMLVTYWGMKHGPISPGEVRDVYDRSFAFLDHYLAADPAQAPPAIPAPAPAATSASPARGPASRAPRLRSTPPTARRSPAPPG